MVDPFEPKEGPDRNPTPYGRLLHPPLSAADIPCARVKRGAMETES